MQGDATVVRKVELTKLGQEVEGTGGIKPAALGRVYAALQHYRALLDEHRVDPGRVRVAATAAARDASNGAEFIAAAAQIIGSPAEVLSGAAEGELTFLGATRELDPADGPFLVIDIGGASTEFSYGHESFEGAVSLDIGSVRLTDLYIESDPPKAEELSNCVTYAGACLSELKR